MWFYKVTDFFLASARSTSVVSYFIGTLWLTTQYTLKYLYEICLLYVYILIKPPWFPSLALESISFALIYPVAYTALSTHTHTPLFPIFLLITMHNKTSTIRTPRRNASVHMSGGGILFHYKSPTIIDKHQARLHLFWSLKFARAHIRMQNFFL